MERSGAATRTPTSTLTSMDAELVAADGPTTATGTPARTRKVMRRGRRALLRPTVQLTAANVGAQVLSMLSGLLVARQLGPVGRGQVSLVQVYDETSTNASSLGVPTATGYFAKERPSSEAQVLGAALTISAFSVPVTALLGWLIATFVFADAPVGIQLIVWAAVGLSPLANSYPMACRMVLVARGQTSSLVPLQILQMALRVCAMLLLILVDQFTPTTAAIAMVASGWLASFVAWRMVDVPPARGGPVREMLAFGLKTVPAALASMANTRLDQMLVAPLISASALGVYSVAVGATILPVSVGVAIAPRWVPHRQGISRVRWGGRPRPQGVFRHPDLRRRQRTRDPLPPRTDLRRRLRWFRRSGTDLDSRGHGDGVVHGRRTCRACDRGAVTRLLEPGRRPRRNRRRTSRAAAGARHQRSGDRLVGRLLSAVGCRCVAAASSGCQLWAIWPRPRWNCRCVPLTRRHSASTREATRYNDVGGNVGQQARP